MTQAQRFPFAAALLSLFFPGLGQLYNGENPKAVALISTAIGIWIGMAVALWGPPELRSWLTLLVLGTVYPMVWLPSVVDAYQTGRGTAKPLLSGQNRWYIILMLVCVGPMSLPLLWQSSRFSSDAKQVWTVAVISLFIAGVLLAVYVLPGFERTLRAAVFTL